jgi:hypothetical protein
MLRFPVLLLNLDSEQAAAEDFMGTEKVGWKKIRQELSDIIK